MLCHRSTAGGQTNQQCFGSLTMLDKTENPRGQNSMRHTGCKTVLTGPQYTCRISETVQGEGTKSSAKASEKQKEFSAILPEKMSIINSTYENEGTSQVAQ